MAIKSNLPSLVPARDRFKREITLLSHGFSNPTAWPDGKLIVYPWGNEVDDFLLQRSRKGRKDSILFDLLPKICDMNGGKIEEFVVSEVISVLLVSRSISRDNKLELRLSCTECSNEFQEELKVPEQLERVGEKSPDYLGYDLITLPCKDVVKMRPLLVRDSMLIMSRTNRDVSDRIAGIITGITAINDSTPDDMMELVTWFKALPPRDAEVLEEQQDKLSPHLSTEVGVQCPKCSAEFLHRFSLDESFFRPSVRASR